MISDNGCPGCKKTKPQSNKSGGKKKKKFGNRSMRKAYEEQEERKQEDLVTAPKFKHGGSVLGFDVNNLKTSNFKKLK